MKYWFEKDPVRALVDMHIPNGDGYMDEFDPEEYAENISRSGASAVYIDACSCLGLCYYPTKVGLRHRAGERDIFKNTVEACRKRSLKVIGKMNTWATFQSDLHPDWDVVDVNGKRRRDKSRFGCPCINNDEFRTLLRSQIKELCAYDIDGVWVDMIGISAPVCFCASCRKKYGKPLPTVIDPDSPDFMDYLEFKGRCVAEYLQDLRDAAKSVKPEVTVGFQTAACRHPLKYGLNDDRCYSLSDYLAGDFYTDRAGVNAVCRMLYSLSDRLPFEFMTSRCVDLERHTMNKNMDELLLQAYAALMYKGAFLFIDAIDPAGTMNAGFYKKAAAIRAGVKKYLPYADYSDKPMREVAVYVNYASWLSPSDKGKPVEQMDGFYLYNRLEKIGLTLSRAHVDFDIIFPKNLGSLDSYKTLILPDLGALSAAEADAIRNFVNSGGSAYISGITSLRDDKGHLFDNFALSDVIGLDFVRKEDISPCYLAPAADADPGLFGEHTKKYPHALDDCPVTAVPNSPGLALATLTFPVSGSKDFVTFSSAISDPPVVETDSPAVWEHAWGKGRIIWCAARLEDDGLAENRELFVSLIQRLTGNRSVTVDAPDCVDYTAYKKDGVIKLHLLNHQSAVPPIPISRLAVSVDLEGKRPLAVTDVTGGETDWYFKNGILEISTDLNMYKLIVIETAEAKKK